MTNIKAEQQAEEVLSPMGANEDQRLTEEDIALVKQHRAQRRAQLAQQPIQPGFQAVSIPQELAASIFGQITVKQMKARWLQEQFEKGN